MLKRRYPEGLSLRLPKQWSTLHENAWEWLWSTVARNLNESTMKATAASGCFADWMMDAGMFWSIIVYLSMMFSMSLVLLCFVDIHFVHVVMTCNSVLSGIVGYVLELGQLWWL